MARHRMTGRPGVRWTTLLLGVSLAAAACGTPMVTARATSTTAFPTALPPPASTGAATSSAGSASPSASRSQDDSSRLATFARIEADVANLRQLSATRSFPPTFLDQAGLRDYMVKANQRQTDQTASAALERLLKAMGLLPASTSLQKLKLDLLVSQVVGFYDPATKQLYLISSGSSAGTMQKLIFAHEFTHALQDQHFDLARLDNATPDQDDRNLSRTALLEGDATLSMSLWASRSLSVGELLGLLRAAIGPQGDLLNASPPILRQTLTFPYTGGLTFIQRLYTAGGWQAVDAVYARPPRSTAQILHPELYTAGVEPVAVSLPPVPASLAGWKVAYQDTLGELELGIWLAGKDPTSAATQAGAAAATGWAGDRVGLYEGPNGSSAVVVRTVWRSASAAAAFRARLPLAIAATQGGSAVCGSGSEVRAVLAADEATARLFC